MHQPNNGYINVQMYKLTIALFTNIHIMKIHCTCMSPARTINWFENDKMILRIVRHHIPKHTIGDFFIVIGLP